MSGKRYLGLDLGTETFRAALVEWSESGIAGIERRAVVHENEPEQALRELLSGFTGAVADGGAATGRLAVATTLSRVPIRKALAEGFCRCHPGCAPALLISIGSSTHEVLEIQDADTYQHHSSSRCSQGTGNFLRQLTGRLGLTVGEADRLCAAEPEPARLSGRCPVILKTDMTHLANSGVPIRRILAGLFDAVSENVETLIRRGVGMTDAYATGGVTRSVRVRAHLGRFLASRGLRLHADSAGDDLFLAAVGAALEARRTRSLLPAPSSAWAAVSQGVRELPALRDYLDRVTVMRARECGPVQTGATGVIVGLDIGSTGSKGVAFDIKAKEPVWEWFTLTRGDPVAAAKRIVDHFLEETGGRMPVRALGVTGSGRKAVGSLLRGRYGDEHVFVLNEIAAHAEGALHHDPDVDTIFEIGGQDSKYIRLSRGKVFESAMNQACSAGTGSFIEEQGARFAGVRDVRDLGVRALAADRCVSLGQHCSVFMAEVIEKALAAGAPRDAIIAGIYDSVVQNYLNRVKGARMIGRKIFCQGMPFSSPALAAAVARQTGRAVVVPPSPGMVGALGIALLANKELAHEQVLDLSVLDGLAVESKDQFVCMSTRGCGPPGNRCRIDRLRVKAGDGSSQDCLWGGGCTLYDSGCSLSAGLPDRTPDPFRGRRQRIAAIVARYGSSRGRPRVGVPHGFVLMDQLPLFLAFVYELGLDPVVLDEPDASLLRRGQEESFVPMCAPMQLYAGVVFALVDKGVDHLVLPMMRDVARVADEPFSTQCPLSQGSADLYRELLRERTACRIHRPVLDMGPGNLGSALFRRSLRELAFGLGVTSKARIDRAYRRACDVQIRFQHGLAADTQHALEFAESHGITPVVVVGRTYTIHSDVLNGNVPHVLRELGALPVPVDGYTVADAVPVFEKVYWGNTQQILRAAHQVRERVGQYSVFCSNYSCGPDSFNLHFYVHLMAGKPFAIIETDGHAGDAGTQTRLEAFLYGIHAQDSCEPPVAPDVARLQIFGGTSGGFAGVRRDNVRVVVPRIGETAAIMAAALRGDGLRAEALPLPDEEALELGRRHTSGKECLPAVVTLGSILKEAARLSPDERLAVMMPSSDGPCRFGMYHILQRLIIENLDYDGRVTFLSPMSTDYFEALSPGGTLKFCAGYVAGDFLFDALLQKRPVESVPGTARRVYDAWYARLLEALSSHRGMSTGRALVECLTGVFGLARLVREAAAEFGAIKITDCSLPTVALVGEIYMRFDPFSNGFLIEKLEARGLRVKLAPFQEWVEYVDVINMQEERKGRLPRRGVLASRVPAFLRLMIQRRLHAEMADVLGWAGRYAVERTLEAGAPYVRRELLGEAILTVGFPLHELSLGGIDGAVSVGPLECMPNKIAEGQFVHVTRRTGLPVLTLSLNGDPPDEEGLDAFVYEVNKFASGRSESCVSV